MKHHLPAFFIVVSQMIPINTNPNIPPFNKTIQLYGDRSGGQGNFEFAGFAELQHIKVVLVKGNEGSLEHHSDWRRLVRLILLAQRIEKPVLLWNLPLTQKANKQHPILLAMGTAIQNAKIQLLKLQQPIINVFDEKYNYNDALLEEKWGDGMVIIQPEEDHILPTKLKRNNLKFVKKKADISEQILNLLNDLSDMTSQELVANRLQSFKIAS